MLLLAMEMLFYLTLAGRFHTGTAGIYDDEYEKDMHVGFLSCILRDGAENISAYNTYEYNMELS